jgi:hypothetical protein
MPISTFSIPIPSNSPHFNHFPPFSHHFYTNFHHFPPFFHHFPTISIPISSNFHHFPLHFSAKPPPNDPDTTPVQHLTLSQRLGLVPAPPLPLSQRQWQAVAGRARDRGDTVADCAICLMGFAENDGGQVGPKMSEIEALLSF